MKPVFYINSNGIQQSIKLAKVNNMSLPELNNLLAALNYIGIEEFVTAEDAAGNEYGIDHMFRLSIKDVERYINVDELNIIYKKNLLHVDEDGTPLIVPVFERHISRYDKSLLDRCLDLLENFKVEVLIRRDAKLAKSRIGHHYIDTHFVSFDYGRRKTKHLGFSNQFDDIFKLIENL